MGMAKKRLSIKFRLLLMVASLVLLVFVMVSIAFNVLISQYIENNATEVLSQSRGFTADIPRMGQEPGSNPSREERPERTPTGKAEVVILSSEYEVLAPGNFPSGFRDNTDIQDFTDAVRDQAVELDLNVIDRLETESGLFYYTSIASRTAADAYIVYFINMSDLYAFEKSLTGILWIIMLIAMVVTLLITYLIASRISGPVKDLSNFAKRIGEGDYARMDEEFKDLELHELKTSMNETTRKLEAYDTEQRVFFQNVSHELRTPLQIIKNNAEGIEYDLLDRVKASKDIKDETDKLGELVEDIIYLSRLEARSKDMVYTENDLRETLSYTLERNTSLFKSREIQIVYDFQDTPVLFEYDEKSIERAFQNLISNAIRYTRDRILVTCRNLDGRIVVAVEDNGEGIRKEDLPRIFDRFYKGENGVHGIGLSIVKSIITSYGGRIEVRTGPEGTAFTVFL